MNSEDTGRRDDSTTLFPKHLLVISMCLAVCMTILIGVAPGQTESPPLRRSKITSREACPCSLSCEDGLTSQSILYAVILRNAEREMRLVRGDDALHYVLNGSLRGESIRFPKDFLPAYWFFFSRIQSKLDPDAYKRLSGLGIRKRTEELANWFVYSSHLFSLSEAEDGSTFWTAERPTAEYDAEHVEWNPKLIGSPVGSLRVRALSSIMVRGLSVKEATVSPFTECDSFLFVTLELGLESNLKYLPILYARECVDAPRLALLLHPLAVMEQSEGILGELVYILVGPEFSHSIEKQIILDAFRLLLSERFCLKPEESKLITSYISLLKEEP